MSTATSEPTFGQLELPGRGIIEGPRRVRRHIARHGLEPAHEGRRRSGTRDFAHVLAERTQLLNRYRLLGHDTNDPAVRQLVDRGIEPAAGGMPTGAGSMAFVHNLPADGSYVEDTDSFFRETERNDIPQAGTAFTGLGGAPMDFRIPNVGVLASIRAVVKASMVVSGTGAVTANYGYPWNLAKRISLNVNGQTSIISAEGMDLRARRQRYYRNPREQVSGGQAIDTTVGDPITGVIANGTYPLTLVYDLPIVHDDYNLAGALFAQSDQNAFSWRLEPAAASDMFSIAAGGAVAITGTVFWLATVYDIPFGDTQQGRKVLLPNMSWIHGFLSSNQPYNSVGELPIALIRTAGQLLCVYVYLDNGGAAVIDPLALSEISFRYGGNRRPRTFNPPELLVEKNVHDYNGRVLKPAGYFLLDNEVDNPQRDLVYPKGVTELQVVATIPVGTTINANARAHYVEETMFVGR